MVRRAQKGEQSPVSRVTYSWMLMRVVQWLLMFTLVAGCGGKVRPSASESAGPGAEAATDAAVWTDVVADSSDAESQDASAWASDATDAIPGEGTLLCETQDAGVGPSALQYADWVCEALFVCTYGDAGDIGGACFISLDESLRGKSPTACLAACLAILGPLQGPLQGSDAAACQGFSLSNLPPECTAAFR
jgi:hypothetical protein